MIFSYILVFLAVFLTGISQVLLKIGASHRGKQKLSILDAYLNLPSIIAYGLLLFVTVIYVYVLIGGIPLKLVYTIASLNIVVVICLSWVILKEKINKKIIVGIMLVCLGIVLFNIPS